VTDEAPVALHITPPFLFERTPEKFCVALSMWESDRLPRDMFAIMDADMLIVPSSFCRTVFQRAGFRKPVVVVPLGIWPEQWDQQARTAPEDGVRRFLWVGAPDTRKGIDVLVRAWREAFAADDSRVHLTIKTTVEPGLPPVPMHALDGVARCLFIAERLSWPDLRALYLMHDVFLFPTFGEGFGLPVLEAMAAGLLCLTPAHTGLKDFVHRGVAWIVQTERARAQYGVSTIIPLPKLSHLKALMRAAVEDFPSTVELRQRASAWAKQFSWERTVTGMLQAIQRYARRRVA
jgi:glycosyltransferase involved in cell wall biosynthesis